MVDDYRDEYCEKNDLTGEKDDVTTGETARAEDTGGGDENVNRRRFLKAASAAALAATGAAGKAAAATTVDGIQFDRVVDGVADLGMDPNGNQYVHNEIEQALSQPGTLLELPPGTYKVPAAGHTPQVTTTANRVGIRGTGDRGEVRIITDRGMYSRWLRWSGRNFLLKNVVYDQYDSFDTMLGTLLQPRGGACKIIGCGLAGSEPSQRSVGGFDQGRDPMLFQFNNSGGHIVIDDWVDMTPVQYDDYPHNRAMFWGAAGSTGSAEFRNMWVSGGSGSVIYFGKDRMAPILVENCHFQHVHDKAVRLTGNETTIRGCTWWYDDEQCHPDTHVRGGGTPSKASTRSVWAQTNSRFSRGGPTIEDCHIKVDNLRWGDGGIDWNQYTGGGTIRNCCFELNAGGQAIRVDGGPGAVTVEDSAFTGSSGTAMRGGRIDRRRICNSMDSSGSGCARPKLPDKFPGGTLAPVGDGSEDTDGSEGTDSPEHTLTVQSMGSDRAHYEFTVSESVEGGDRYNPDAEYPDAVDGSTATGSVAMGGSDDYRFDGEVTDFTLDGPAEVFVDGQALDLSQFESDDGPTLDRTLTVESTGEGRANYEITVTGEVEPGDQANLADSGADYPDAVDGSTASGSVALYGSDDYQFTGEVDVAVVDGPAEVYADGEQVQTQEPETPDTRTLEITSTGNDRANYEVSVTGDLEAGEQANLSAEYPDAVDGSTASGSVALGGTDSYQFTGEVDVAVVDGPAEVFVDGEQVQVQEPKQLEISSTGMDRAHYELTVTGEVESGARANLTGAEYPDEADGSTASGSVALYGSDDYQFTGDLDAVTVDGPAEVSVDGEPVDLSQYGG